MRYAVLGGDLRFVHLVAMLNESGRQAVGFLQEKASDELASIGELRHYSCVISNWPMRWPLSEGDWSQEELLQQLSPGSVLLLCGPKFPQRRRWDLQYINLWEDETLLQENAYLTAEAAVAIAASEVQGRIGDLPCAVVGYGRIGRALTEILLGMNVRVLVVSGHEAKRRAAQESGAEVADLRDVARALVGRKLIFSTPPATVIDAEVLRHLDLDARILDLASPPYGVDLDAARELNLHAGREPGLPGRYCPLSAARAIFNAVLRWEEEECHDEN